MGPFASQIVFAPNELSGEPRADAIRIRWLGTAGFEIEHAGHVVLIDPYLTRASIARCVFGPLRSDRDVVLRHVPRAHAIVAGHTHFDHVLDVPTIAEATGATVYGSKSAVRLCRAHGIPERQLHDVERSSSSEPVTVETGPFRLRFVPSAHSKFLLGRVPFPGDIADCDDVPVRTEQYRCGAVFGVEITVRDKTIYHVGSADLVDASIGTRNVDLALLCVAGWTSTRDFPERILRALSPQAFLLSHWDSFVRPIDAPVVELPAMRMERLVDRLVAGSRDTKVGTLPLLGQLVL